MVFAALFAIGFRSARSTPAKVAEMALSHAIGDKVEAAYRRGRPAGEASCADGRLGGVPDGGKRACPQVRLGGPATSYPGLVVDDDRKLKQSVTSREGEWTLPDPREPRWTFDVVFDPARGTTKTRELAARCAHAHGFEQIE